MYNRKFWQDHVTQYENRYTETANPDGSINHVPVEGAVLQEGTPQNAANFNNAETGIFSAHELAAELTRTAIQQGRALNKVKGESGTVTLTNNLAYPFNSTKGGVTVSLAEKRDTTDYTVDVEASSPVGGGGIGRVTVFDKLLNGFKIAFTGGAASVTVKYIVRGGVY